MPAPPVPQSERLPATWGDDGVGIGDQGSQMHTVTDVAEHAHSCCRTDAVNFRRIGPSPATTSSTSIPRQRSSETAWEAAQCRLVAHLDHVRSPAGDDRRQWYPAYEEAVAATRRQRRAG